MFRGLHFKLALIVTLGALVLASAGSMLLYGRSYQSSLHDSERSVRQLLATVQVTASIAAYVGNSELGQQVVDGLVINDVVLGAALRDLRGFQVRAGKFSNDDPTLLVVHTLADPFSPNEPIGELAVLPNRGLIESRAGAAAFTATVGLATHTFLVAFLVMGVVYVMLTKPLVGLSTGLHRIVPGEKERLTPSKRHQQDEFGKLVSDINRLLDTVEEMLAQERSLRERVELLERRFRGIFEGTSAGIFLIRESGTLVTANPAFYRTLRTDEAAFADDARIERYFSDADAVRSLIQTALQVQRPASADLRLANDEDASPVWVHALFSPSAHVPGARLIEGVIYDISERKRVEEAARRQAELDPLTQLPNRQAAEVRISEEITRALEHGGRVSLMLLDLDHFKPINDSHGHDAGDRVLVEVAARLVRVVRATDLVARLGGDEFLIVLAQGDEVGAARIAEQLVNAVATPIELQPGLSVQVGASIGMAGFPHHAADAESLRAAADAAMYAVKRAGRNGYAVYALNGRHRVRLQGGR